MLREVVYVCVDSIDIVERFRLLLLLSSFLFLYLLSVIKFCFFPNEIIINAIMIIVLLVAMNAQFCRKFSLSSNIIDEINETAVRRSDTVKIGVCVSKIVRPHRFQLIFCSFFRFGSVRALKVNLTPH